MIAWLQRRRERRAVGYLTGLAAAAELSRQRKLAAANARADAADAGAARLQNDLLALQKQYDDLRSALTNIWNVSQNTLARNPKKR